MPSSNSVSIKLYWSEICQNCRGKKIREIHLGQSQLQRPRVFAAEVQLYVRFFLTPKDTKHCCVFLPYIKAVYHEIVLLLVCYKKTTILTYKRLHISKKRGQNVKVVSKNLSYIFTRVCFFKCKRFLIIFCQ